MSVLRLKAGLSPACTGCEKTPMANGNKHKLTYEERYLLGYMEGYRIGSIKVTKDKISVRELEMCYDMVFLVLNEERNTKSLWIKSTKKGLS